MTEQTLSIYLPGADNTLVRLLGKTSRLINLYSNSYFPKASQDNQALVVSFSNIGSVFYCGACIELISGNAGICPNSGQRLSLANTSPDVGPPQQSTLPGRLMHVRWWLSRARFIRKAGCNELWQRDCTHFIWLMAIDWVSGDTSPNARAAASITQSSQTNRKTRLRPALKVKTDYVDTIGACPSNQDGERILTINLSILSVFTGGQSVQREDGKPLASGIKVSPSMGLASRMILSSRLLVGFESSPLSTYKHIPTLRHGARTDICRLGVPKV